VNLLNVVNTQTFSELIHELLNILYLLNILNEKKPTEHYDPVKEAAKPQWQKPKKPEIKGPVHTYFISSDEDEPEP